MSIVTLPTAQERREREDLYLEPSLIAAELGSFTAGIISPLRTDELRDLGQSIRNIAESHVQTRTPQDLGIRPHRDTDDFAKKHDAFAIELSYALWLLAATRPQDQEAHSLHEESQRLALDVNGRYFSISPLLRCKHSLRAASKNYLFAAIECVYYKSFPDDMRRDILDALHQAITIFAQVQGDIERMEQAMPQILRDFRDKIGPCTAAFCLQEDAELKQQLNLQQRGELAQLMLHQHTSLIPEILFNLARCHALAGDHAAAMKTLGALEEFCKKPESLASPAIQESAALLEEALRKAKDGDAVIAESPKIVLAEARRFPRKFGGVEQWIWLPEDQQA